MVVFPAKNKEWKKEEIKRIVSYKSNWSWTRKDGRIKAVGWGLLYSERMMFQEKQKQSKFGWTSESQLCLLLFWISVLSRKYVALHFWGNVYLDNSFLSLFWNLQRWKATKRKKFLENVSPDLIWSALGSRSNILLQILESLSVQEAAVCPLHPADYISHQRVKELLFQEFKWGGWGICCKQTNQPFSLQSMTAKTVPAPRRGLNGSLPFATKVYNMWPTFTSTACTSLGMFFVAHWI